MNALLLIKAAFWLWSIGLCGWVIYGLGWAIKHKNDWPEHCARVAYWKEHFNHNVAHGWIFGDGVGS